jgi:type IV pilus biogenesis protein PilP
MLHVDYPVKKMVLVGLLAAVALSAAVVGIPAFVNYLDAAGRTSKTPPPPSAAVKSPDKSAPDVTAVSLPPIPAPPAAATVGDITVLTGTLDILKLRAQIAEQEKKIADLLAASTPKTEAPVLVTMPPAGGRMPPSASPAGQSRGGVSAPSLPRVISIEGMDGRSLRAALSTSDGIKHVSVGDVVSQGRIERIDVTSVVLETEDGEHKILSFLE